MDLVERYLQAVKMWLPAKQKEDIVAELREDIRSDIEEKEAERDRKLSDEEVAEVLKRRGRPLVAAGRYRTQGVLIGPVFYPIYLLVLRLSLIPFLMLWTVRFVYQLFTSTLGPGDSLASWLGPLSGRFWSSALWLFAIVTLAFAVLERVQARTGYLDRWNPRALSPCLDTPRVPRSSSFTEMAVQIAFTLWWIRPTAFITTESHGYTWSAGATWARLHGPFFLPILALMLVMAGIAFAQFLHPRETVLRVGIRAVAHWATALIATMVVVQGWATAATEWRWLKHVPHSASAINFPTVVTDVVVYLTVASIGIGAAIAFAVETVRILRLRRGDPRVASVSQTPEVLCI